ncbi:hypothetical protein FACS1894132_11850 [Clostridia bacterium]|nr:hypothetical protein FACS1894132_11850 [Clostridia bacterium]
MKRIKILFIVTLILLLGGCNANGNNKAKETTNDGTAGISFTLGKSLDTNFKYVKRVYKNTKLLIHSIYEYELEEVFSLVNLNQSGSNTEILKAETERLDIKSTYDNDFFEKNALILYNKTFSNCNGNSIPAITSVVRDGNTISINATRYVTEDMNDALQPWAGFIEVKKADVEGVENVVLNVVEVVTENRLSDYYPNGY